MNIPDVKIALSHQDITDLYTVSARDTGGDVCLDEARAWLRAQTQLPVRSMPGEYLRLFVAALYDEITSGNDLILGRRAESLRDRLAAAV